MYDCLDRPIAELGTTDRAFLRATRAWVHALTFAGEPAAAVATGFSDDGRAFDSAMALLDRASVGTIEIQRPCHPTVEESEAVILGIWRLVLDGRLRAASDAAAAGLVDPALSDDFIESLAAVEGRFA